MRDHMHDRVEEYLMDELEPFARGTFESHIAKCRSCANYLRDARESKSYLAWLRPVEAPPQPGPDFYRKLELSIESIERKSASGWLPNVASMLQGPRLAFPLLFLVLGLLLTAWTMDFDSDLTESAVLGIPPARFSDTIASDADRLRSREMVMVSLVEETD